MEKQASNIGYENNKESDYFMSRTDKRWVD